MTSAYPYPSFVFTKVHKEVKASKHLVKTIKLFGVPSAKEAAEAAKIAAVLVVGIIITSVNTLTHSGGEYADYDTLLFLFFLLVMSTLLASPYLLSQILLYLFIKKGIVEVYSLNFQHGAAVLSSSSGRTITLPLDGDIIDAIEWALIDSNKDVYEAVNQYINDCDKEVLLSSLNNSLNSYS